MTVGPFVYVVKGDGGFGRNMKGRGLVIGGRFISVIRLETVVFNQNG